MYFAQSTKNIVFVLTRVARNSPRLINLWPSDSRSNWNLEMLVFEERGKQIELEFETSQIKDKNGQFGAREGLIPNRS